VHVADAALEKAVTIPSTAIHAHVARLRARNPHATPEQLVRLLEKEYVTVISAAGGAVGAAAAAPAVGTGVALALTASDVATFFGASAAFTLAVASVHGIEVDDVERRQGLLMTTILGESGAKAVTDTAGLRSVSAARALMTRLPMTTVKKVNATLTRQLVKKQAAKQTGLALGRLVPFGIGIVVGIGGARALGRQVIRGARAAFGPAPAAFPATIEITPRPAAPALPTAPQAPRAWR
jgi:hypothetical protein